MLAYEVSGLFYQNIFELSITLFFQYELPINQKVSTLLSHNSKKTKYIANSYKRYTMKVIKISDYTAQTKLASNASYYDGWIKSLENFEKRLQDPSFKGRRSQLTGR